MKPTIQSIRALNIKGRNIDEALTPLTAVIGANAGGKTSIANAITIGLLGHLPALGKKPSATILAMTPGAKLLDVQLLMSDGQIVNRRFDVKRSVSQTLAGTDFSEDLNPVQLDFEQFNKAKATDRQRILESLLVATADGDVIEDARARIAKAGLEITVQAGEGWLQALEVEAKEAARFAKQELDTASKTILQLQSEDAPDQFSGVEAEQTASKLAEFREKQGAAREAFDELARRQQEAPDKPDGEQVTQAAIDELERKLEAARAATAATRDLTTAWNNANREAAALVKPFEGIEPIEATSAPMTAAELMAADHKVTEALRDARDKVSRADAEADRRAEELEAAIEREDELLAHEQCPTCGIAGKGFQDQIKALCDADIEAKKKVSQEAAKVRGDAHLRLAAVQKEVERLASEKAIAKSHDAFIAQRDAEAVLQAVTKPEQALTDVQAVETKAEAALKSLRREAQAWADYNGAKVPTDAEVVKVQKTYDDIRTAIGSLEDVATAQKEKRAAWDLYLADQKRLADLTEANDARVKQIGELKGLADWAKAKSLELTAQAMEPLLAVCNEITEGLIGKGTLAIEGTLVGIATANEFRQLELLSGSEAVAVSAAIQVAIAGRSSIPLVMIDELSRFSKDRKRTFIENLARAINQGIVGQVIVFDHDKETGFMVSDVEGTVVTIKED